MSGPEWVMVGLAVLQGVWGLVMVLLNTTANRIDRNLADNTTATKDLSEKFEGLITVLHSDFAKKESVRLLGEKYDKLNREMGELTAEVRHAVLHR